MDSFRLNFKLIWLYILLLGCAFQLLKGDYSSNTGSNGDQIYELASNEKGHILQYHKSDEEDINREEVNIPQLFPSISSSYSSAIKSVANYFNGLSSSITIQDTQLKSTLFSITSNIIPSNNKMTAINQWITTSSNATDSSPIDSKVVLIPVKSKSDNKLFSHVTSLDTNLDFTSNEDVIYQWSLENEQEAEAVYYSIYPDFTDPNSQIQLFDQNFRELRSIADEELQSFVDIPSITSELPLTNSMDLIQPTPVAKVSSAAVTTTNNDDFNSTESRTVSLPSHDKKTGIDDIINGLVHLLGDNVKVANSTDRPLSINSSHSVMSMRINNRGPPSIVPFVPLDEIVFTSLTNEIVTTSASSETTVTTNMLAISASSLTTDKTAIESSVTDDIKPSITSTTNEISVETSITNEISSVNSNTDEISVGTSIYNGITVTTSTNEEIVKSSSNTDKITISSTPVEIRKPVPITSTIKINTSDVQTYLSSETKFNNFTTTEPSAGWRPVQPFKYSPTTHTHTNLKFPPKPTQTENIPYISSITSHTKTESIANPTQLLTTTSISAHQPLIPSYYDIDNTKQLTTSTPHAILSTEELSLITANEETFGDILLTATGVMGGGAGAPTKASSTQQQTSATKESLHNNNDESVYIDGRRQYFTLQDDAEGSVKSGVVENQPPRRPHPIKPAVSTTSKSNVHRRKQTTTPTIRIDTCIVGDDTACDTKNHEVCRTEGGVSSCTCPPGLARAKSSNECIGVVSLLVYLRIDHINGQRLFFDEAYTVESPEKEYMKNEAVQGISSLFRMSSLAPIFVDLQFNSFYAIGAKLATNVTVMIQESPHTSTQLIKQVISRELISTLQQKNHSLGKSHLSVDSRFNPIPSIQDLNECADSEWNDCSVNADCENTFGSFKCNCWPGFTDKFSHDTLKRGRVCTACSPEYCNNHGICILNEGKQECRCRGSYIGHKCEIDSEVLGVALGASLAALLIIILTFICLCMWSRRWKKDHQKPQIHSASPSFTYMDKTNKVQYDLHSLVSDNTLQWFPMRDTRSNFYSVEPPEMSRNALALAPTHGPYSTIIRSNHLSHSQTKLMGSDDCINETQTRFYVPRPKARLRTEYQNIYSDPIPIHDDDFANSSRHHRPYDGQNLHPFYN